MFKSSCDLKNWLPLCLLVIGLLMPTTAIGSIYVVFRYDDFSADQQGFRQNHAVREHMWKAEQSIDALFKRYGIPYQIGIIPKADSRYGGIDENSNVGTVSLEEDQEKIEFIKYAVRAGRVEVTQHDLFPQQRCRF